MLINNGLHALKLDKYLKFQNSKPLPIQIVVMAITY